MDHIDIDVHKNESQLRILGERGELGEQLIRTTPELTEPHALARRRS